MVAKKLCLREEIMTLLLEMMSSMLDTLTSGRWSGFEWHEMRLDRKEYSSHLSTLTYGPGLSDSRDIFCMKYGMSAQKLPVMCFEALTDF